MDSYSLSDLAVATGNGGGFGGNWGGALGGGLVGYILGASTNGGGLFGGGRGNAATTDELSAGFNFAGINNSLKDITGAIAGVNQNLGNAICSSTYELASKIDKCCFDTQAGIQQVRYDMAVQNGELKALIQQNKIESLQQQLTQMQIQQATCGIPRVNPNAWGVYPYTCNPCGGQVTMG